MDPIYVTGHRNPDTDSIVAAIAYAALRAACGQREYQAACLGSVSNETQIVLDRFGFAAPPYLDNLYNQVRDLDFDRPPILSAAVTVGRAWDELQSLPDIAAVPVAQEDGTLYGILSRTDISDYNMSGIHSAVLEEVPLFNVLSVLEGRILNEAGEHTDTLAGEVTIALPQSREELKFRDKNSIVLCGHQPDMIQRALDKEVRCLVLCQAELPEQFRDAPTSTCVIATPFDAYRAARLIFQSTPVGRICKRTGLVCFHLGDRVDDVRETVLRHRHSSYPILDEREKVVGILTRYHLLRPRRKRVVLVDHNEAAQSVPGLEQAELLEIIDHHRLADIQTASPIYVRNEPVGATNTILADMYRERGLVPPADLAGMMAAAILSDTVMFKSPTCTPRDIRAAQRMARIAGVSLEELGKAIFSASLEGMSAEEVLFTDHKEFRIAGHSLAVSQITCVDTAPALARRQEFLERMAAAAREKGFDLMLLMLTDVLLEGSHILYVGDDEAIRQAFRAEPKDGSVFLPRVMSRKKQLIPMLSDLWG